MTDTTPSDSTVQPNAGPLTVEDTLGIVDQSWERFWARVQEYPPENMDEPIGKGGWTRKQMLAHIAGWHDLTTERLAALAKTGELRVFDEDDDVMNARFARVAVGRSVGEVVRSVEVSFSRLRRQIESLTDELLTAHDGWAAARIAGNTFEHYAEHDPDLEPQATDGTAG